MAPIKVNPIPLAQFFNKAALPVLLGCGPHGHDSIRVLNYTELRTKAIPAIEP